MDKKIHGKFAFLWIISENTSQCFTNSTKNSGFPSLQAVTITMVGDRSSKSKSAKGEKTEKQSYQVQVLPMKLKGMIR